MVKENKEILFANEKLKNENRRFIEEIEIFKEK